MSIDLRTQNELKRILLNSNGNGKNKPEPEELEGEKDNVQVVAPAAKEVTASIQDVLASYNKGRISFVPKASGNIPIPEGVSTRDVDGNTVTTFRHNDRIQTQIYGSDFDAKAIKDRFILKDIKYVLPQEPEATDESNGVNGEIDEKVEQGGTGDCWLLTGVLALNSTDIGKKIIKSSITSNADGSVTVNFKGVGVSYTISLDEIKKHDTDNIKSDAYSNGDNDMLVLELAVEKLKKDIEAGKVTITPAEKTWEGDREGSIEGGFAQQMLYFLTGRTSSTYLMNGSSENNIVPLSQNAIYELFNNALDSGKTALTFGLYYNEHEGTCVDGNKFYIDLQDGGHALAITNLTKDTVTFVNPWDSTKEYTMTWAEFAKIGVAFISITDLNGLEGLVDSEPTPDPVEPEPTPDPVEPDPVVPDEPVNPDTPTDNGLAELKAQGFTQADIDEYFNQTEDGKYELKSDIKFSYYPTLKDTINKTNLTEKTITTIEELKEFCGANKRKALLDEGWTDELIDKYFIKTKQLDTGKTIYSLSGSSSPIMNILDKHFKGEKQYKIEKDDNGNTIITVKKNYGNVKITVKADGTYTEEVEKDASCSTPDELKSKGFTQEQIDTWFEEVADGIYRIKNKAIATGDYANTFRDFKSVDELAAYIGADSRAALRNQGMPDEIIDQFFELKRTGTDGSFSYELKFEGNYTITREGSDSKESLGPNRLIRIQNKEDGTITEILVKADGTYTIETNEIINIGEPDDVKAVAGSAKELLAQGFTQFDIDKYFYKKNNQYFLRSDITFRKEVVVGQDGKYEKYGYENFNITTLEELKEYSGANSRKALQDKGLPDELIDKYYRKEEGRDGKIVYRSDDTWVDKDGNNTVLTWHSNWYSKDSNGAPCREYTIKPDGTYTVVEYTSNQITDTTRTHYMLTEKGLSESDIKKFFTEKDGLYTLEKGIMYKGQYINSVEDLVDALNKNNK